MADDITKFDIANFNHFGILARVLPGGHETPHNDWRGLKSTLSGSGTRPRTIQDELLHKMHLHFVPDFHYMFVGMISLMADDITKFNIADLTHFRILGNFFGYSTCSSA
ncbi:unnamed protein product [Miscanthus lutarioriparius]|uniref:Uncharacterized protein n=1 Tax=Miscanthus lutarioriparius TaxID=422564 RepID=A0A811SL41_9POAL|nr:unnamed protein product [Miscanthus lutarioriparius]